MNQALQILGPPPAKHVGKYWYDGPGVVTRWHVGVFEGGGAKGFAYAGALKAVQDHDRWFSAVAGASAGAVAAALIASGRDPDQIRLRLRDADDLLATNFWSGLFRLWWKTGYFHTEPLRAALNQWMRDQVPGVAPEHEVTLLELYEQTGIELHIVVADLSLSRHFALSFKTAPGCTVANAVIASMGVPAAFPTSLLSVEEDILEGDPEYPPPPLTARYAHTVADGGVSSNFPLFVFENRWFREHWNLVPHDVSDKDILGFYLEENPGPDPWPPRFLTGEFDASFGDHAREFFVGAGFSLIVWIQTVVNWLLGPFASVKPGRPRRPILKPWLLELLVSLLDLMAGVMYFGLIVFALFWLLNWLGILNIDFDIAASLTFLGVPGTWQWYVYLFLRVVLVLLVIGVIVLSIGNLILLRTARQVVYGLVQTFLAGAGVPKWIDKKPNVIALITGNVGALQFGPPYADKDQIALDAYVTTDTKLPTIP